MEDISTLYPAIAFSCGDGITINCCPEFILLGHFSAAEYWYIRRNLYPKDSQYLWESGFKTLYWTDAGWRHHTPKQFKTAQEAMDCHHHLIK